jgi:hypothetical protein
MMQHIQAALPHKYLAAFVARPCHTSVRRWSSDKIVVVEAVKAEALTHPKPNKSDAGNGSGLVCGVHGSHLLAVA